MQIMRGGWQEGMKSLTLDARVRLIGVRVSVVTIVMAVSAQAGVFSDLRTASAAPILFSETFAGRSTINWIAGGTPSACLTAGYVSGGIPGCPGGQGGVTSNLPDPNGSGALRLTNNVSNQAGYAIYTANIPTANGLDITFDYYAYGGNGADGSTFMLIDGAANPTAPGGRGGSLGYAPLVAPIGGFNEPGIAGGFLAVGLDDYGNFVNSFEGRDVDCPTSPYASARPPDSVTVRGAAGVSGTLSLTPSFSGYCFLATTGTLTQSLDVAQAARTPAVLRRVRVTLDVQRNLDVFIDFGAGYVPVIPNLSLASIPGQPALPSSVKLAFAAATGGSNNHHEVRNLVVRADRAGTLVTKNHDGDFINGSTGVYRVLITNNGTLATKPGAGALVTDTLPAGLTYVPGSCVGTGWVCNASGNTISASYAQGPAAVFAVGYTLPELRFAVNVDSQSTMVTNTVAGALTYPSGPDQDVAFDPTFILAPDLEATAAVLPMPIAGQTATFTATVRNVGTFTATNVALAQTLSGPVTPQSVAASGGSTAWTCTTVSGIRCTAPALGLNASAVMTVVGVIDAGVISGTATSSVATASSTTKEIAAAPNTASASATIETRSNLDLRASSSPGAVLPGEVFALSVVLTNTGPSLARDVAVILNYPAEVTFVSADATAGSYDISAKRWSLATLPVNTPATATIRLRLAYSGATNAPLTIGFAASSASPQSSGAFTSTTSVSVQRILSYRIRAPIVMR
jgi:uncharacterized repeat protein (TIGR01451 family)